MKKEILCLTSAIVFTSLLSFFSVPNYKKVFAEDTVCEFTYNGTTTYFDSPYLALKAASNTGGIVKLNNDVTKDSWKDKITINDGIDVTFDLNGFTYNEAIENATFKRISLGGIFTLKDSSSSKTGKWNYLNETDSDFNNKIVLSSSSKNVCLNIEGGYISNFASFVDAYSADDAVINISGGIFDEPIFISITKKVTLNISGGKFNYQSEPIQIDENGELDINISNSIDGLSLYCPQTILEEDKMNITISDDLVLKDNPITIHIVHNKNTSLDGLIIASFSDNVLNRNVSNFSLALNDTTNAIVKEEVKNWKSVVIGNNLVLKNKDYYDANTPNVSNKLILNDDKGNKVTFTNEYLGDITILENSLLNVNHLKKENKHIEVVKDLEYKKYSIIDVVDTKIMKDGSEVNLPVSNSFFISISLDDDNKNYDKYLVMDMNKKTYRVTNNNGVISFETTELGEYIILAEGVNETKYLLGAIIPLTVILILEIGFILFFHMRKKGLFIKNKSIALVSVIWGGAVPLIVIESILIVLLGAYIIYLLVPRKKKKNIVKENREEK